MSYEASKELRENYIALPLNRFPEYESKIFVPRPNPPGAHIDDRLVHSALAVAASECGLQGAKVKHGHIVLQDHGGRSHGAPVAGTPSEKDIRKALIQLGYADI